MTHLDLVLLIFFIVVLGTALAHRLNVPYPLILVIVGSIIGWIPHAPHWHLSSHMIMGIFLPPILFAAARLISWEEVRAHLWEIFSLSFVLVVVTSIIIGAILHSVIPLLPFSAALVLGAIIAPTDSIAATAILNRFNAQPHLVRTLEIESLFNDAASIVLYDMAVLYVFMGGLVHWKGFTIHLFTVAIGGILVGLIVAYLVGFIIKNFLGDTESEVSMLMSIILAYVSYTIANNFSLSGVLATVAAGLFHRRTERHIRALARLSEKNFWNTLIFFLNGFIFIIIGTQLPKYIRTVTMYPTKLLAFYIAITLITLLTLRVAGVFLTFWGSNWLQSRRRHPQPLCYSTRDMIIGSWSGMRGMVSLALAIALPTTISETTNFPYRDLIIFLTVVVILFTLLLQGLTLPPLIRWLKVEKNTEQQLKETNRIYSRLTKHAIKHINRLVKENPPTLEAAKDLIDHYYKNRLLYFELSEREGEDIDLLNQATYNLLQQVLDYERTVLHNLLQRGEVSEEIYARLMLKIDRDEVSFSY